MFTSFYCRCQTNQIHKRFSYLGKCWTSVMKTCKICYLVHWKIKGWETNIKKQAKYTWRESKFIPRTFFEERWARVMYSVINYFITLPMNFQSEAYIKLKAIIPSNFPSNYIRRGCDKHVKSPPPCRIFMTCGNKMPTFKKSIKAWQAVA